MLSKVLDKSTCANCKFCCSFRRASLWETPKLGRDVIDKYSKDFSFISYGDYGRMMLGQCYKTDDLTEEVPCYFLDSQKGCTLSEEDKPFECKIWPLRLMKKDDEVVIALAQTCPAINQVGFDRMKELVETDLFETIKAKAIERPYMIEKYRDTYKIVCSLGSMEKNYVKVFSMHASAFNDEKLYDACYENLSLYRKEKVDMVKQANDKKMAVAVGVLLDKAFKSIGIMEEPAIAYNDRGKPYLRDYPDVFFNISHSHGLAVVAIANTEVGIDAEAIGAPRYAVAQRFFTKEESMYLDTIEDEKQKANDFFRLWTAKEAVMKLTGLGMKLPLDAFCVELKDNGPKVTWQNEEVISSAVYLYDCPVKEDYVCTLAGNVSFANIEIISYNIKDDELKGFSL